MSSNQIGSFSMTDRSVEALKQFYSQGGVDAELFYPHVRGASPSTISFVGYVQPATMPNFGSLGTWNCTNDADYVEEVVLELQLSAITGVATPSYKNDITTIFDQIIIYQGGTQLQVIDRFDMLTLRNQALQDFEKSQGKQICENVQPLAARQAAAAAPQTFEIEIPTFLDYLSVPLSVLQGFQIQIQIMFKPLLNCVQWTGAGTPTASILNANLRMRYVQADAAVVQKVADLMKVRPILLPFIDTAFSRQELATGSNSANFLLTDFKGPCPFMGWMLREKQQVEDTTGNPLFEISNTRAWTDWNITDKGYNLVGRPVNLPYLYSYGYVRPHVFRTYADPARLNVDYCTVHSFGVEAEKLISEEETVARGYYDFSMTQTARLQINFPVTATPLILDTFEWAFNAFMLSNGRLSRFYS